MRPEDIYQRVGQEKGVHALVDRFYDLMDTQSDAKEIRAMHPADLSTSRDKLHWFLVGWLGGPQMYVERFGHPRLRARHLPFKIASAQRDAWLRCMLQALDEKVKDEEVRTFIVQALVPLADHMRNVPDLVDTPSDAD